MTSTPGYFDRKPSSSIRPGLSHLQASPSSPHTPTQQRTTSAFNSPSLSYRAEEDPLIFDFGTRHFSAGFTGESYPRCTLGFGPEESRRVGDYRRWLPNYDERPRKRQRVEAWGDDHELWRMDLRDFDLGVMEDKVERAVREAYTKYLLLDSKARRVFVILPSVLPRQLLSSLLSTLFNNFTVPSITLLSPPILSTFAAGCRSGLIVDIGWRETVMTAVYEYREISQRRTTRAMRAVTLEMAKLLEQHDTRRKPPATSGDENNDAHNSFLSVELEQAEEVTTRMAWCQDRKASNHTPSPNQADQPSIAEDNPPQPPTTQASNHDLISLPSPTTLTQPITLPFTSLTHPIKNALFTTSQNPYTEDDNDQPLHNLLYTSLLHLPPDIRALCMSRIIITGGGSNIPGLKSRLLDELTAMVEQRGWDPVSGPAAENARRRLKEISSNRQRVAAAEAAHKPPQLPISEDPAAPVPVSEQAQIINDIDAQLLRAKEKDQPHPVVSGVVRGVETLGAWAGASLLANLRIKGVVDIEREAFLQGGLAGARRAEEMNGGAGGVQKGAVRAAAGGAGMGERSGWTLGTWA
ncbi:hypothetical protein ACLMJK_007607 [Lecanora helva]